MARQVRSTIPAFTESAFLCLRLFEAINKNETIILTNERKGKAG
jgi:hypothetical protein